MIKQLAILLMCMLLPNITNAESRNLSTGVNAIGTHNDNLGLASDGATKIDDFILQLNPYVSYKRDASKLKLNLDYQLQGVFYSDLTSNNKVFHQLSSNVDASIYEDIFFVKASAKYGQANISSNQAQALNNISLSSNRTNIASVNVNPYGVFKFGQAAKASVGVDRAVVRYKSTTVGDSDRTNYYASLDSGPKFQKIKWNANYTHDVTTYKSSPDITFERYDMGLDFSVSRKVSLLATVGNENNNYQRATSTVAPDSFFWDAGLAWKPSTLTSFEIRFGDRFYGKTGLLKLTHKTAKTISSLNYKESVTTSSITDAERQIFNVTDPTGASVSTPGQPNPIDVNSPATAETFIRKLVKVNAQYNTAKSIWSINAFHEKRIYQTTNTEEKLYGASGKFDWNFMQRTRLLLTATGQIREFRGGPGKEGIASADVTVERQMRRNLTGRISAQHIRLDSSTNANDYKQNLLLIGVNWKF